MIFLWVLTWYSYWLIMKNQINPTNIIGAAIPASLLILSQFSRVRDAFFKTLKLSTFQTDKNTRSTDLFISSGLRSDKNMQISPVTSASEIQSPCLNTGEKPPQEITISESITRIQDPCINPIEGSPQETTVPESITRIQDPCVNQIEKSPQEITAPKSTTPIQSPCVNQIEKSPQEITAPKSTTPIQSPCVNQMSPQKITVPKTQKQEPKSILLEDKSQQPLSGSNRCPKNLDYFTKKPRPKQAPEECMTCKNLISCVCQSNS